MSIGQTFQISDNPFISQSFLAIVWLIAHTMHSYIHAYLQVRVFARVYRQIIAKLTLYLSTTVLIPLTLQCDLNMVCFSVHLAGFPHLSPETSLLTHIRRNQTKRADEFQNWTIN